MSFSFWILLMHELILLTFSKPTQCVDPHWETFGLERLLPATYSRNNWKEISHQHKLALDVSCFWLLGLGWFNKKKKKHWNGGCVVLWQLNSKLALARMCWRKKQKTKKCPGLPFALKAKTQGILLFFLLLRRSLCFATCPRTQHVPLTGQRNTAEQQKQRCQVLWTPRLNILWVLCIF